MVTHTKVATAILTLGLGGAATVALLGAPSPAAAESGTLTPLDCIPVAGDPGGPGHVLSFTPSGRPDVAVQVRVCPAPAPTTAPPATTRPTRRATRPAPTRTRTTQRRSTARTRPSCGLMWERAMPGQAGQRRPGYPGRWVWAHGCRTVTR